MAALRPDPLDTAAADATSSAAAQATPRPGRYEIDTSCSAVTFRTRHLFGLAPVRGSFAIRAATIDVAEPVTDSSIHAEIDTASFRTGNGQRDVTVHSARLLDAVRYPVITFISEGTGGLALPGMLPYAVSPGRSSSRSSSPP
jgi:polyisoprenoid-binding protein YceI